MKNFCKLFLPSLLFYFLFALLLTRTPVDEITYAIPLENFLEQFHITLPSYVMFETGALIALFFSTLFLGKWLSNYLNYTPYLSKWVFTIPHFLLILLFLRCITISYLHIDSLVIYLLIKMTLSFGYPFFVGVTTLYYLKKKST